VELQKYGDNYAVKNGVKEGRAGGQQRQFLIDAESKVQGALKSW